MRVLLVEDEQSMLFTLTNLLKHRGHEVIASSSAEEGLQALGKGQVDLVISDLRLPGMDGISLIAEVKNRCEDVVPIIISAYGTLGNAIDTLKLNACDFLRKPFDLSTFEEALGRAEQRRNQLLGYKQYTTEADEKPVGGGRSGGMLSQLVSKNAASHMESVEDMPAHAGQGQKVTVLFVDISDFTGLSEKLDQKSLVFIVNTFYSSLEPILKRHGGILDKFMGDGILVVFDDPSSGQEAAYRALGAAIQIQGQMERMQHELRRFALPEINIHIGVCTGIATVCAVDTGPHLARTYIGDTVTLAKRLQDLAGPGEIIVSEATTAELKGCIETIPGLVRLRPLPPQAIEERQQNVRVYQVEYLSCPPISRG